MVLPLVVAKENAFHRGARQRPSAVWVASLFGSRTPRSSRLRRRGREAVGGRK